jgi:glycosyltransferase involved in cell wall biosynthesis
MEHQKRISLVIDTMIEACRLHPKVDCVVIGDGGDLSAMKQRVENAELSDRIVFTGRLEPEEVRKKLAEAHAILLMSDFEGLPVALLEGMACGVVPIARRIPSGIPELVQDDETGILVDDSPQQAAEAICSLADNPEKWSKLSQNARRLFESEFSEAVSFAKWKVLIHEWIRQAGSQKPLRIPRRWRLPKPIDSKMNPDIRRPPWYLKAYWKTRIRMGALRRKWFLRSPQAKI